MTKEHTSVTSDETRSEGIPDDEIVWDLSEIRVDDGKVLWRVEGDQRIISVEGVFGYGVRSLLFRVYHAVSMHRGDYIIDLKNTERLETAAFGLLALVGEAAKTSGSTLQIVNCPLGYTCLITMVDGFIEADKGCLSFCEHCPSELRKACTKSP